MNIAAKLADRQLGHNPISTGRTEPITSATETMHAIVWRGKLVRKFRTSVVFG